MSVKIKTLIIITLMLIGLLLLTYFSGSKIILGSFENIEEQQLHAHVERAENAMYGDMNNLTRFAADWSNWDDSYAFIEDKNNAYIKSNLTDASFTENSIQLIAYLNTAGKVVYGKSFDTDKVIQTPILKSISDYFGKNSIFLNATKESMKPVKGILQLPEGLLYIVSSPIMTSERKGPVRGVLIMARFLTDAYIRKLGERTRLSLTIHPIDQQILPEYISDDRLLISQNGTKRITQVLKPNRIAGYSIINDINGLPAFIFKVDSTRDIYQQGLRTLNYLLFALIVTALIFSGGMMALLQKTVIGRLSRLSHDVNSIHSHGVYNSNLRYEGNDEISSLTKNINTMLIKIKESLEDMESQKEKAEKANQAKSEFLSRMSHELRTPLNGILGFAQLLDLESRPINPEHLDAYTKQILSSGQYLLTLINDLLDLASIEENKLELSIGTIHLDNIIHECLDSMMPLALERNITLAYTTKVNCTAEGDALRLKQILLNLISNAIKYNHEGGDVDVTIKQTGEGTGRIIVTDSGPGISKQDQNDLFKPFSRLYLNTYATQGTGIGLTISKKLVEMMGGTIGVESKPGKGSAFWVELALNSQEEKACCEINNTIEITDNDEISTEQTHTILYVEDNPSHIELIKNVLKSTQNNRLLTAHTPQLGLELALAHKPDLIILDINLPGMDGYEMLSKLKKIESLRDTAVIALSANAMPREIEKGLRAGFLHYLIKPLEIKLFKKVLNELLS